jgi:hypothetical protein
MNPFFNPPAKASKKEKMLVRLHANRIKFCGYDQGTQLDKDFRCLHCGMLISGNPLISGVRNRNHCPFCLHSRHLDLYQVGDRLSACKAVMKPVGLALKETCKKYRGEYTGELMLVHACNACEKISINRIAADDDAQSVLAVLEVIERLGRYLKDQMEQDGIVMLAADGRKLVQTQLFGKT